MNDYIYDIALSYDESLTPIEKITLFNKYGSSRKIIELSIGTLKNLLGRRWTGSRFDSKLFLEKANEILPYLNKAGIGLVRFNESHYPEGLKSIPDCPFMLYYRGNIKYDFDKAIAIVGTRKPDEIGLRRVKLITTQLVKNDFTIISGLAHGIDTSAHYNCVINNGKTLAVLGCGIDRIYPFSNKDIARRILDTDGAIISEYPPGIKPTKWNFPRRNRIIVGLSKYVLIIQAPSKSGSLISAFLAADYNRELFVVKPDKSCGKLDEGNRQLIFTGAKEIQKADDIIKNLNY